jgi:succinate-acetate transporter protein
MKVEVIAKTLNSEVIAIKVWWGYFTVVMTIIKVKKESQFHNHFFSRGGYG